MIIIKTSLSEREECEAVMSYSDCTIIKACFRNKQIRNTKALPKGFLGGCQNIDIQLLVCVVETTADCLSKLPKSTI